MGRVRDVLPDRGGRPAPRGSVQVRRVLLILTVISLLDVLSFSDAIAGFGTEFVWLLVVTFIVAQGMMDVGLGRRVALGILRLAGGRSSRVLLALLGSVVVLSFMVPTAAGRISMLLPVCLGIVEAAGLRPGSSFAKAMLIGTSYASIMAGTGLVTAGGAEYVRDELARMGALSGPERKMLAVSSSSWRCGSSARAGASPRRRPA